MEKNFDTGNYLIQYNDCVENVNIGPEIPKVDENSQILNVNKSNEYVAEVGNSNDLVTLPCPVYDENQGRAYFQLHNSSGLIPISVNSIQAEDIPNVFGNNYFHLNTTQALIVPENYIVEDATHIVSNVEQDSEMDVDTNKINNEMPVTYDIKDVVFISNPSEFTTKLNHKITVMDSNNQPLRSSLEVGVQSKAENASINTMPNPETHKKIEDMKISEIKSVQGEHSKYEIKQCDSTITEVPSVSIKNSSEIYLKCQYILKDIPKDIVLGNTVNGKKLVARIIQAKIYSKNSIKVNKDESNKAGRDVNINDDQFAKLVHKVLRGAADIHRREDLNTIKTVIMKMSRNSELKHDLHKQKLIITRILQEEDGHGLLKNQSEPTIITGRFIRKGTESGFVHVPDMLQQNLNNSDAEKNIKYNKTKQQTKGATVSESDMYLHVGITETKNINNITLVSVLVNKRYLSLSKAHTKKAKPTSPTCETALGSQGDNNDKKDWCSEASPEMIRLDNRQPQSLLKKRVSKTT